MTQVTSLLDIISKVLITFNNKNNDYNCLTIVIAFEIFFVKIYLPNETVANAIMNASRHFVFSFFH